MSESVCLIKGYLPVRLKLESDNNHGYTDDGFEETFFFVKEHREKGGGSGKGNNNKSATLFVVNVPTIPGIDPKRLLKSLLGRYAEIKRVTLISGSNRRENSLVGGGGNFNILEEHEYPSFLKTRVATDKFAHVVFSSKKDLNHTIQCLKEAMKTNTKDEEVDDDSNVQSLPGLTLDKLETQILKDKEEDGNVESSSGEDSDSDDEEKRRRKKVSKKKKREKINVGILTVAERYRTNCFAISRSDLMDRCNIAMESYENAELEQKRIKDAAASGEMDDDGFITVAHSTAVGTKRELEMSSGGESQRRKKGKKRNRNKKQGFGATELSDFYRFQKKENRKRTLQDLRKQFQEDLERVKRMKEEKKYRPF